jgi:hypothetical protein
METDPDTVVLRRFSEALHGATLLTLHCDAARPGKPFGTDVVARLGAEGLLGHVLWSTACTPRDVDVAVFRDLRESGLYLVRLELDGIAGNAVRLRELVVVVHMLRQLGLLVTYDLDLFEGRPRENLVVLRTMVADGTIPAVFRSGSVDEPPWLQQFRDELSGAVPGYLELSGQLADAWADVIVGERLLLGLKGVAAHRIARPDRRQHARLRDDRQYDAAGRGADRPAGRLPDRLYDCPTQPLSRGQRRIAAGWRDPALTR